MYVRYNNKQILLFNPLSELVGGTWMIEVMFELCDILA